MDDYEVYVVEDDDDTRNAVRDHRSLLGRVGRGPGMIRRRPTQVVGRTGRVSPGRTVVVGGGRAGYGRTIFGGLTLGELIEAAAYVLAAIQPLPAAPAGSGKPEIDTPNLIMYQAALAKHAKRDEQLRTIGTLVSKVVD